MSPESGVSDVSLSTSDISPNLPQTLGEDRGRPPVGVVTLVARLGARAGAKAEE